MSALSFKAPNIFQPQMVTGGVCEVLHDIACGL